MKPVKSLPVLRQEFEKLTGGWSQDTIWMAKASMLLTAHIVEKSPTRDDIAKLTSAVQQLRRDLQAQRKVEESLANEVARLRRARA